MLAKYRSYLREIEGSTECVLCAKESLKQFTHWRIVQNRFPYDLIAETHHMLIPNRHVVEDDLTVEELVEIKLIKQGIINETYDWMLEPTHKNKSMPAHFHLHLLVGKVS